MIKSTMVEFLQDTLLFEFDDNITEKTDLFKEGIIDSYGYIQLLNYIKSTYGIEFTKEEILSNVITNLSDMVKLIELKITISQ